ncbi:uncharacterized protein LOC124496064 [Dermatophagoides farinae]|uniref:Uncharacterized protein n=1 Tax=Dermatophagoides farinae TaxID=6954 RepID=A0A9D4NWW8_DERFA|nr:uncharacterized protein LOC124496064 [Dermatophagoides farinae]KAH7640526.1 hypothetical protein HUG17_7993 [Dermatophagoides farinae]
MATSDFESQLRQLVAQSKPYVGKEIAELESNVIQGWLQEEQKKVNKLYQQIDRICRLHGSSLPAKLFNESRDTVEKLEEYIFKLKDALYDLKFVGGCQR